MRWAILQFPGSNCDQDCLHVLKDVLGQDAYYVWHKSHSLENADGVIVPGGFSYGDYLRCGAISRFANVMDEVRAAAQAGKPVIGICNGFQILCEAGLLPGALLRNRGLHFICDTVRVRVERPDSLVTAHYKTGQTLELPIAHGEGSYYADEATLERLQAKKQILFTYVDAAGAASAAGNPNGSRLNIAGICNEAGNVVGLMPHPERAAEAVLGSTDGLAFFQSAIESAQNRSK
jgi:phosphoribosylformylglycinamidine synthase I